MIPDTDFIIALREERPAVVRKAAELEAPGAPLRVSVITVFELYVGVGTGSKPIEDQREHEALIVNKPLVGIDENLARRAGVIEGVHYASNEKPQLGPADALIAATGLQFNEAVVSTDENFTSVDDLDVVSP